MLQSSTGRSIASILLLLGAGATGLFAHYFLFMLAIAGGTSAIAGILAGKAILAGVGGYVAVRALGMPRKGRITLLAVYEIGPLLMVVWAFGNLVASGTVGFQPLLWFLPAIPDVVLGRVGISLARPVDEHLRLNDQGHR
jgi:hypothetical protein